MKSLVSKILNVIAFILLAVNFLNILFCGYGIAENRAIYSAAAFIDTTDMYLTFKEDTSFEEDDETIVIPKGTVIKPENLITLSRIGFYYTAEDYSYEEIKQMSYSECDEKGICYLNGKTEDFEEQEELERLWDEANKQVKATRTKVNLKIFLPVVGLSLVWLAGWFFSTRYLCKKKMYVLLYLLNVVFWFAVYFYTSTLLYH